MRWPLVGLVALALVGCNDARPERYQLGSGRLVFDTQTGRLCIAMVPRQDTGNLSAAALCDPTLFNPEKMVDSLALVMANCRDTLNVPVPKPNEDPIEAAIEAGLLRSQLMSATLRLVRCRGLAANTDGIDPEILKRAREREAERPARPRTP